MKKIFLILVICIGFGAANLLNAQWVCDNTYWGDKYAYNKSKEAFIRIEEYSDILKLAGTRIEQMRIVFSETYYNYKALSSSEKGRGLELFQYLQISFQIGESVRNYEVLPVYKEDYTTARIDSYLLLIKNQDTKSFWSDFRKATRMTISYTDHNIMKRQYEFDMSGSSKAYTHVVNGKTPTWDK
jgi:hypothetical protein